jgi:hypothetical protein
MVCLTDQQEHKNACLHIPLTSAAVPQIKTITPSIFKLLSSLTFCATFNHQCHVGPGLQPSQEESRARARERGARSHNRIGAQRAPDARERGMITPTPI